MEVNQVGVKGYVLFKKCGANRGVSLMDMTCPTGSINIRLTAWQEATENFVAVVNHTLEEGVE